MNKIKLTEEQIKNNERMITKTTLETINNIARLHDMGYFESNEAMRTITSILWTSHRAFGKKVNK